MPQMDGSIRIGTKIETKEVERELKNLESSVQKTADKIASLRSKMDALKDVKLPTQEYQEISAQIEKAEQKFDRLLEKQKQMQREGKDSGVQWQRLNDQIADTDNKIALARGELQSLVDTGKAFTFGSDTDKYAQMTAQMEQLTNKMQSEQQRAAEIQSALAADEERLAQIRANSIPSNEQIISLLERKKQLTQEIADMERAGLGYGQQEYDSKVQELASIDQQVQNYKSNLTDMQSSYVNMVDSAKMAFGAIAKGLVDIPIYTVKNGIKDLAYDFPKLGSAIKNTAISSFKLLGSTAKKAFNAISNGSKKSSGLLSTFTSRIKSMALSLLIFNWIRKAFNSMISGMKQGFSNFMNYSTDFANSVQSMKNAMSTLGNQFAAAFAPIVQMILPWLTKLINAISTAMTYVAQFVALLGGKSTFTRAKQVQDGYNKSLSGTAAAAKKAYGALAKFDDLDVLQKQEEDDAGGGAAGAMGDLFEEVPISDQVKDFFDMLKEMWENSDFYELGRILGEKLKEALDNIPWDEIKEIARKIGKSIASFINGFIEVEGLGESIGRTLAEVINTAFEFLNAFVHELHWDSIGKFIAETINGFFTNIDWNLIYDTFITGAKGLGDAINSFVNNINWGAISTSVSNFFNTFINTIYTFITTVNWAELGTRVGKAISDAFVGIDWSKAGQTVGEAFKAFFDFITNAIESVDWWAVGESVKDFLVGIDWAGIAESFFEAVGAAFGGFAAFLGGLISEGVENAREYFEDKIEEAGGNVVEGILVGIAEALVDIGNWVKEHIFTPFIEGFKSAFGIHSPSTVMQEMGTYIIQGLLDGINSLVGTVTATWESMKQTAIDVWNTVQETLVTIWETIVGTATIIWESIEQFFSDTWENIKLTIETVWESITTTLQTVWENIKTTATLIFEAIRTFLAETWDKIKEKVVTIWNAIKEKITTTIQTVQTTITNVMNTVKTTWSNAWDALKEKVHSIMEGIKEIIQSAFDWISDMVSSIGEKLGSIGGSIAGKLGFGGGASTLTIKGLTQIPVNITDNIPHLASGSVIRGGNPFLAMLGDQPHGQTNIEAPLSTIKQAVREELSSLNHGGGLNTTLSLNVNGEEFARLTLNDILSEMSRQGYDVEVLGVM